MKSLFKHIAEATAIGFPFTLVCLWIFGAYEATGMVVLRMCTVWYIASILYGVISMIYDFDILSLPVTIIIHFIACFAITIGAAAAAGLLQVMSFGKMLLAVAPVFVIIYAIISVITTIAIKRDEKQINNKIKSLDKRR